MKMKNVMLVLAGLLFIGLASCSKSDDSKSNGGDDQDSTDNKTGDFRLNPVGTLEGSDYYLMFLDDQSKTKVASKVAKDYRLDGGSIALDVWEGTFVGGTPSGKGCYGGLSWICFNVANKDWAGMGIINNAGADFTAIGNDHYLHFAIKTKTLQPIAVILKDDSALEARVSFNGEAFIDNGNNYTPIGDFPRDGEWQEIEIPMSKFFAQGMKFKGVSKHTMFGFVEIGAPVGTNINLDAIFIYKPAK